jgi:hypothetical protein
LSTLVKFAVMFNSTQAVNRMRTVPGTMTLGAYSGLREPATALFVGVLAIPQALLVVVLGPYPQSPAGCLCDELVIGRGAGAPACASTAVPPRIAALVRSILRISNIL